MAERGRSDPPSVVSRSDGQVVANVLFDPATEFGRDLAVVDWASTPLGPVSTWPPSLRSIVRLLLGSRFAMWMAWGPDLTFLCNDAYRRDTLGAKYPWALGKPAREVWSEIWTDIGPRIESVIGTGIATWDESLLLFLERSGYQEETYHTFSYSPIADDDGRDQRNAVRGQRGDRPGHRGTPDGDRARSRHRAGRREHAGRGVRGCRPAARVGRPQPALRARLSLRRGPRERRAGVDGRRP